MKADACIHLRWYNKNKAVTGSKCNHVTGTKVKCTSQLKLFRLKKNLEKFPGGSVVKTSCFQDKGCGFDPWSGN